MQEGESVQEALTFHFEGSLADEHKLNFYESARFQYAAARLLVKLAQFRQHGKFNKNISSKSNFDVNILVPTRGSFNINVEDEHQGNPDNQFIDVSLGDLVSFVSERVVEKLDETSLKGSGVGKALRAKDVQPDGDSTVDDIVQKVIADGGALADIPSNLRALVKRRVAEVSREESLLHKSASISKIDFARGQNLVSMAAPLMSEMATALRRSADTLEVKSNTAGVSRTVLFLDQRMASEIETAVVDEDVTLILCNVIQFNKDNGWGKIRFDNTSNNGSDLVSFSVPYDILPYTKQTLIAAMNKDQVYIQAYFVRDRAGRVNRLIVAGILPAPST
ncbi:hypothetical protein [Paracoccus endophyticus]|uniref:hypothetical protein n=1 Tax=Paracoccus endophyticus TaxID=2233774 RepID=UPI000DD5174C|nr:hypothetical protein [Paracoccus endophyticus]